MKTVNMMTRVRIQASGMPASHYSRGFSMMEILVTVMVLAIGLLGLAALQGESIRGNHSAYMRTQATYLAYEIADAMRANVDQARNGQYNISYGAAVSGSNLAALDLAGWRNRVNTTLPSGDSEITQNGDLFNVDIRWNDVRDPTDLQVFSMEFRP